MTTILARRGIPELPKLRVPHNNVVNNSDLPDGLRSHTILKLRLKSWTLPPLIIMTPDHDTTPVCKVNIQWTPAISTWDLLSAEPATKLVCREEPGIFFGRFF